jgi:hypothetical protein
MCMGTSWLHLYGIIRVQVSHEHHWECTDIPGVYKCINKSEDKCKAKRTYDKDTEMYTVMYTYKRLGASV